MVSPKRLSTGESNLDLHSRDMSRHPACRPEVVIWPLNRNEVSQILGYANQNMIPVTAWGAGNLVADPEIPTSVESLVAHGPGTLANRPANMQFVKGKATQWSQSDP